LGEYTIAQNTQQAPTSFIGAILNRVGLPVFSSVANDPARLRGALRLSLNIAMFVFMPCMLGIALTARPLVILLFGERWAEAAPILRLLAIAAAWWPLHVLNLAALSALGRSDLFFRLEVLKKTVLITLILIASPWGPVAIAASVLCGGVFGIAVNTWYSKRLLGYGAIAQLYDQKGTFALSLAAGAAGWTIMHMSPPGTAAILGAVAIAVLVYLGGAWITGNKALAELLKLVKLLMEQPENGGTDAKP
jgi:O-antigen/teichoic acid export membrane protein